MTPVLAEISKSNFLKIASSPCTWAPSAILIASKESDDDCDVAWILVNGSNKSLIVATAI